MRQLRFEQRVDQDWSTSPCMEDQVLVDTHERRNFNMDPTMVLAQQRMHVGESTHEVDRSGRVARKDTSATTSSLEIGTNIKEKEKDQGSFRQLLEQSETACR